MPSAFADLVNINTADSATLQTLNGIGSSKAQAIIDYRTQNGPFQTIEDIQNVSGIGPATYDNIKDYVTVGDIGQTQPAPTGASGTQNTQTASSTPAQNAGGALPPPIAADITGDARTIAGAGSVFQGSAYGTQGEPLTAGVRYLWNFGDGEVAEGARVLHTYHYPGTYALTLSVAYDYMTASAHESIEVTAPAVSLVVEGDGSLTIYNNAPDDLNIGLWSLADGSAQPFVIPEGTTVLAGQGVRFAAAVTGLPGSRSAQLLYPNGTNAAAAEVAANSPLRGEVVAAAVLAASANLSSSGYGDSAAAESPETSSPSLVRPPTDDGSPPLSLWYSLAGLAALLALGAWGTWWSVRQYQPTVAAAATSAPAEEFEIE